MINQLDWYRHLTTPDPIWRAHVFDRVTITTRDGLPLSIVGKCYSEFSSGPNLRHLAETAGQLTGQFGFYGLQSCRKIGHLLES